MVAALGVKPSQRAYETHLAIEPYGDGGHAQS